jgi:hypothetical protein
MPSKLFLILSLSKDAQPLCSDSTFGGAPR